MLLGGVNEQYKTMYEQAMEVVKKHLLYRPMTIDSRDILLSGKMSVLTSSKDTMDFTAEGTHLTCFAGGMLAIGAKIFDRPDELDLAAKLADGCLWAYNSTETGIMPEEFLAVRCESTSNCVWNESKWWDALFPFYKRREQPHLKETQEVVLPTEGLPKTNQDEKMPSHEDSTSGLDDQWKKKIRKRQLDEDSTMQHQPLQDPPPSSQGPTTATEQLQDPNTDDDGTTPTSTQPTSSSEDEEEEIVYTYNPPPPPTHEEYVKARIEHERLPHGFVRFMSRKYILRPEAIESIFILYRVTGDTAWQEKGWEMFQSIVRATRTDLGHTAIQDVTSSVPVPLDVMESFWSAETLKYFYLLFEDPSVVSLDEWVL